MKRIRIVLVTVLLTLGVQTASQAGAPLQLALWPPFQITPEENAVTGLRLNIYGRNTDMSGVDLGFLHQTTGNFKGLGVGLSNRTDGDMNGVQLSYGYVRISGNANGWVHGKLGVV